MSEGFDRRAFLAGVAGAAALPLGGLGALRADEVQVSPTVVQLNPDIEPLVRLIEDTPRGQLLDRVAARIKGGTTYGELLTAVMLAGVRGIKPRPVGFKFHAVLVVNSAHLASLASRDEDRWLPMLWALDNYKSSQERNRQEGGWMMAPVAEDRVPAATQARKRFVEAMDSWDEEGADLAVTSMCRNAGGADLFELFWHYGARDFRDIGHKAIYAANAWRTLQTIGWRHAEPIVRSLAFAMLEHEGDNPARRNDERDRPGRENLERARKIQEGWQQGKPSAGAMREVLAMLRKADPAAACDGVVAMINKGVAPSSVWDGLFLAAGELLLRQPGIVGIHCLTSANALYFAYQMASSDETRRWLMLQTSAFLALFRETMKQRGKMAEGLALDELKPEPVEKDGALQKVLADLKNDKVGAARQLLGLLEQGQLPAEEFIGAARRLIFHKGRDSHDYKFSSAVLEDYYNVSPTWRNRFLAMSVANLRSSRDADTDLLRRAQAAFPKT